MGRSVPAVTYRVEKKILQWEKFRKLLSRKEKEAYERIVSAVKNRRTAIGETDESDIGVAILLAAAVNLKSDIDDVREVCSKCSKQ